MTDREKVLSGLEHCRRGPVGCQQGCPYTSDFGCRSKLAADVLELLKEQEPQSVIVREEPKNGNILWFADCPKCKHGIERDKHKRFCGFCGQEVKWDALD